MIAQCKSRQTVAAALAGDTSTLEAKSQQVDLEIFEKWSRQKRKIWIYLRIAIVVILILKEGLPSLVQCTCLSKIVLYVFLFNPYIQRIF